MGLVLRTMVVVLYLSWDGWGLMRERVGVAVTLENQINVLAVAATVGTAKFGVI